MDKKLSNELEVRAAARTMMANARAQQLDTNTMIHQWLEENKDIQGDDEQFRILASLLSLPEDQFALLAPVFLEEMEHGYNDPATQLVLVQMYNLQGVKEEDLREEYFKLADAIDEVADQFSAQKRDFLKQMLFLNLNVMAAAEGIAKRIINIPIELCHPNAKMPAYAHLTDAGMDIYALEDITIAPGETVLVPTGIKVALPAGYELQVRPKSGRCLKTKLRVANTPGTIDAGYRDEIGVIIDNIDAPIRKIHIPDNNRPLTIGDIEFGQSYTIGKGEKFAQLVLSEVPKVAWYQVDSVTNAEGENRNGGFGSSSIYSKEDPRYGSDLV